VVRRRQISKVVRRHSISKVRPPHNAYTDKPLAG
jgi:hypothetical protein